MVKMLTVLVSTISNSQVFLLKNVSSFCKLHFFSKNISVYAIFNDQSFNDTLTNNTVSFEQQGPDFYNGTNSPNCSSAATKSRHYTRRVAIYQRSLEFGSSGR